MFGLFKPKDFTKIWRADPDCQLVVDLLAGTFSGVSMRAPIEDLSFLGPVEDAGRLKSGQLCYYSRGFYLDFDDEGQGKVLDDATLYFVDYMDEGYLPFQGTCMYGDTPFPLDFQSIVKMLGEPQILDEDEDEIILHYTDRPICLMFEFSPDYTLNSLDFWKDMEEAGETSD